jgi:hypothetical protein
MLTYRELLNQNVDRSNSFIKAIDRKRTVVHMLDVQNLCLDPAGADYIQSVAGAPSGADTIGPAKKVLARARAEGFPVLWSLWGLQPDVNVFWRTGCPWQSRDLERPISEGARPASG